MIRAIEGLTFESALGALLTGIMVLAFLRDWRSALIVVVNIPLALLGAVLALWLTGETVNIMTLGGLALAIGVLVDMSTVVIENIHTHLASGKRVARAVVDSGREVAVPLLIAMLCVLAVFVPSLFMVGAARAMFLPLSLAVGFRDGASYLLSSTLVPILSVWLLRGHEHAEASAAPGASRVRAASSAATRRRCGRVVRARWVAVAAYVVVSALVIVLVGGRLGTDIFPKVESGSAPGAAPRADGHARRRHGAGRAARARHHQGARSERTTSRSRSRSSECTRRTTRSTSSISGMAARRRAYSKCSSSRDPASRPMR